MKGNGELMSGGFKIFGHSLVYYPSWIWNSVEQGLPINYGYRNRYTVKSDVEEKELVYTMLTILFEFAEKIDFGIQDAEGSLPLHLVNFYQIYYCSLNEHNLSYQIFHVEFLSFFQIFVVKEHQIYQYLFIIYSNVTFIKMGDFWKEEDNQSALLINSPVVKKLLTPEQLKLPLPYLFLKFAKKEHFTAKGAWDHTPLENMARIFQVHQAPFELPQSVAVQFMKDIIALGVDFASCGESVMRHFTANSRDVWPQVLDLLFQTIPRKFIMTSFFFMFSSHL